MKLYGSFIEVPNHRAMCSLVDAHEELTITLPGDDTTNEIYFCSTRAAVFTEEGIMHTNCEAIEPLQTIANKFFYRVVFKCFEL